MALDQITVTTADLDAAATKIKNLAGEYKTAYTELYSRIQEMKNGYTGIDNQNYTAQLDEYRNDFQYMYDLMMDYAEKLTKSAAEYRKTQQDIANQAKQLSTGLR